MADCSAMLDKAQIFLVAILQETSDQKRYDVVRAVAHARLHAGATTLRAQVAPRRDEKASVPLLWQVVAQPFPALLGRARSDLSCPA